ncbi:glycosyltransferase family 39 protein [Oceanicoccus sp. KOV_DT_Chl]|uniref:ArnT family glycosyltransferase n=1 Tax=Oceanicoccus sp. KOV_DT_Chl TaxID=1904639 RepID=UPI000C7A4B1E|nr:hypothetical protein [Oceanicoccus sp. KOV_DT_Chl]
MLRKQSHPMSLPTNERIRLTAYFVAILLVLCALLYNHFQMISASIPLDYNEAAQPTVTATIASGENPYTLKNQPSRASVYPVLYNIIVAPLTFVFGNNLELHRSVVAIFILGSCVLCYFATYKESRSASNSLASAILYYAALLFYSTPIASPNSTGLFFFLASIFIPWQFNFSNRSLVIALILGILAFYSKQYFIASLGYLSLYLFIAVSKKKALAFGILSLLSIITSLIVIHKTSPYFLDNTFFSVKIVISTISSNQAMLKQMSLFFEYYLALLLLTTFLVIYKLSTEKTTTNEYRKDKYEKKYQLFNFKNINAPLLSRKPNYILFCLACSISIIVLILGKNPANNMTYLFQIMSPFFLIASFKTISNSDKFKWISLPLIVFSLYKSYEVLPKDFTVDTESWRKLEAIMSENKKIYGPPIILTQILNTDKPIYQNGHTNYFMYASFKPEIFKRTEKDTILNTIWQSHISRIYKNIEDQEFDLIILDRSTKIPAPPSHLDPAIDGTSYLKKYYEKTDILTISLIKRPGGGRYNLSIWRPKGKIDKITEL